MSDQPFQQPRFHCKRERHKSSRSVFCTSLPGSEGEKGGGAVGCSQIIRSRCPFQSFLDRTLTALSPLDDVATGIGNSYFSSIQPISHPPRSSSTCISYSETRLIRKLSVRVIDIPVLSGLSLENMYKIFQRRDKRNLWASHRSPITQGQTFVTLTMKRYKKCFRQLLLALTCAFLS